MEYLGPKDIRQARGRSRRTTANQHRRMIRVLIVDEDQDDVDRYLQEFKRAQLAVSADVVQTPAQFLDRLQAQPWDVVLADADITLLTPHEALALLEQQDQEIPFILVTSSPNTQIIGDFMRNGASDCVDKMNLMRLPHAVLLAMERTVLRREQDRVERELRHWEAHYHALLDNPTFGICRFDAEGRILQVNDALVAMLGYESKKKLMAVNLATDIIRNPREREHLFELYRETGHVELMEIEWTRRDGAPMRVRLSGRQALKADGDPEGCEIIAEDVTAQRALEDHLRHLAATDPLTGLANYRKLTDALDAELRRSDRSGRSFAVLLFDLDGLKQINDHHGHLTGSRALCRLAEILRFCCRSIDTAARYGGDEFAIVLPETTAKDADLVARRICDCLVNDLEEPRLSVSVGMAVYPADGRTTEALLHAADMQLYKMKALGKIS